MVRQSAVALAHAPPEAPCPSATESLIDSPSIRNRVKPPICKHLKISNRENPGLFQPKFQPQNLSTASDRFARSLCRL